MEAQGEGLRFDNIATDSRQTGIYTRPPHKVAKDDIDVHMHLFSRLLCFCIGWTHSQIHTTAHRCIRDFLFCSFYPTFLHFCMRASPKYTYNTLFSWYTTKLPTSLRQRGTEDNKQKEDGNDWFFFWSLLSERESTGVYFSVLDVFRFAYLSFWDNTHARTRSVWVWYGIWDEGRDRKAKSWSMAGGYSPFVAR